MADILKKYDDVISLGWNCFPKKYITTHIHADAYKLFDYTGSACGGILEMFKNDFKNVTENLEPIIICNNDNKKVYTNIEYYIRFTHEPFYTEQNKIHSIERITNRINRFKTLLKSDSKIIFIRYEESIENRIMYDQIKKYYEKPEYEYLQEISDWLKTNTILDFKIIYLNKRIHQYDTNYKILSIKDNFENVDWSNVSEKFKNILNDNKQFLLDNGF